MVASVARDVCSRLRCTAFTTCDAKLTKLVLPTDTVSVLTEYFLADFAHACLYILSYANNILIDVMCFVAVSIPMSI